MTMMKESAPAMTSIPAGAIDHGNGRVTFGLYAPWKKSVHLMGDFNGWSREGMPMQVNDEGMWTAQIDLKPVEYAYQFVIDAGTEHETVIADPYSRKLRHVEGRPEPHSLIEVGQKPYVWNDADFRMKPLNELLIYDDLGVSAIELMPVQEFPGDRSWGYNPSFFFCPESSYGSADELKALVDGAHQRGISVILDVVFNHTDASNPLTRLYPYQESPYFGQDGNPWGFPDFNHWSDATKRLMRDIQDYWLLEFHIDGFRYDHSEGIGWDAENGMNFIAWAARQTKPHAYLIAENLNDHAGVVHNTHVDASWHESFHSIVRAQLREGDYQGRAYGDMPALLAEMVFAMAGYADNAQAINYIENHDQERIAFEVRTNPTLDIDQAVNAKSKLGALALFTATGVPMIYAGQEFGMSTPKTVDANKLQWERLDDPTWRDLRDFYASLGRMLAQNRALQLNNLEPLVVDSERKVLVFKRWDEGGNQVVVGLNFSPAQQHIVVNFPRAGNWHEWTKDYNEMLGDQTKFTVELPPSGGKVWVAN